MGEHNISAQKIGTLLESHKHLKKLAVRNPKQLNLIILKRDLLKSVENLNRLSDANLNTNKKS